MIRNAMSVDVEDWFQVGAFETVIRKEDWPRHEVRVERNTDNVLQLFADADVKATFFTLGWVAERHPALIRRIADAGHEVASHGCDHKRVFQMDAAEFAEDVRNSKAQLEQAGGVAVTGYRAPNFSIDARTPWAHRALAEAGYSYSSSVAPLAHDHYGWPEAPRFMWRPVDGHDLVEFPVSTVRVAGRNFAAGGGGFFRLLPYHLSRWAVERVNGEGRASVFYFHPWDMDPDQPFMAHAPLKSRLRHYTNLGVMAAKLRRLTRDFAWTRVDEIVSAERGRAV
jgi:polysaccharide deacetylase family protein (PEP-CTERM system associated)